MIWQIGVRDECGEKGKVTEGKEQRLGRTEATWQCTSHSEESCVCCGSATEFCRWWCNYYPILLLLFDSSSIFLYFVTILIVIILVASYFSAENILVSMGRCWRCQYLEQRLGLYNSLQIVHAVCRSLSFRVLFDDFKLHIFLMNLLTVGRFRT